MSGKLRIDQAARLKAASLAERLEAIGIVVPDQAQAERMKHAMLLGLPLGSSWFRMRYAYLRKIAVTFNATMYREFQWDEFCKDTWRNYGGYPPAVVHETSEKVARFLPDVQRLVHATHDDPWLVVSDGNESVILHGWFRARRGDDAHLVL